jgi:hypothetical protein
MDSGAALETHNGLSCFDTERYYWDESFTTLKDRRIVFTY